MLIVLLHGSRWHDALSLVVSNYTFVPTNPSDERIKNQTHVNLSNITVGRSASFTISSASKIAVWNNSFNCLILKPTFLSPLPSGVSPVLLVENNTIRTKNLVCSANGAYHGLHVEWTRPSGTAGTYASISGNSVEGFHSGGYIYTYRTISIISDAACSPGAVIDINDNTVMAGAYFLGIDASVRNVDLSFRRNTLLAKSNTYGVSASLYESRVYWESTNDFVAPFALVRINHLSLPLNGSYVSIRDAVVGSFEYTSLVGTSANNTMDVRNVRCSSGNINVQLGKSITSHISIAGVSTKGTTTSSVVQGEDLAVFEYLLEEKLDQFSKATPTSECLHEEGREEVPTEIA